MILMDKSIHHILVKHQQITLLVIISAILQTVKEELSDTASTCSDTMETGEQMDYSMQSGGGLSSFLAAFAADAKKHFNVRDVFVSFGTGTKLLNS